MRTVGVGANKKLNELDALKKANSELEAKLAEQAKANKTSKASKQEEKKED